MTLKDLEFIIPADEIVIIHDHYDLIFEGPWYKYKDRNAVVVSISSGYEDGLFILVQWK